MYFPRVRIVSGEKQTVSLVRLTPSSGLLKNCSQDELRELLRRHGFSRWLRLPYHVFLEHDETTRADREKTSAWYSGIRNRPVELDYLCAWINLYHQRFHRATLRNHLNSQMDLIWRLHHAACPRSRKARIAATVKFGDSAFDGLTDFLPNRVPRRSFMHALLYERLGLYSPLLPRSLQSWVRSRQDRNYH
jgi:hypothetical protein